MKKVVYNKEMRSVKYAVKQSKLPDSIKHNPEFNIVYSKTLKSFLKKLGVSYHSFFSHIKNGYLKYDH